MAKNEDDGTVVLIPVLELVAKCMDDREEDKYDFNRRFTSLNEKFAELDKVANNSMQG
jgi:hypothetical protein